LLSQRIKCAESKSWCLGMLRECLLYSSMRLGVPFIALRRLGAVECIPGRQFLPSVAWRTGHCPVRISFLIWRSRPLQSWSRWRTGNRPVNFSRPPPTKTREQLVDGCQPGAPDTVRCTTGQSGAPRLSRLLAASSHSFLIAFSLILTFRQTC
jgi:hypothetical protein